MKYPVAWVVCLLGTTVAGTIDAQESARLRFAWPDILVAQVQAQKTRSKQIDGQAAVKSGMSSQYVMRSRRQGDRHLLSFSDVRLDPQQLVAMPAELRAFMDVATKAALPSFVVSRDGDFVSVDDLDGFQSAMRSAFATLLPEAAMQARLKPTLETMLNEAVLKNLVGAEWNRMAGSWAGAEQVFDIGVDYVLTTQAVMPVVNAPLTQRTRFTLARTLPCERQGRIYECVELQSTTTPDEAEARKAVEDFSERLMPDGTLQDALKLRSLNYETRLELVTETGTLIPHRYKLVKTVVMSSIESGNPRTMRQVDETEQIFSYKPQD